MYFVGSISGASGAFNNQQSGGFALPPSTKSVYLVPSVLGLQFELGVATGATNSTFQTTAARGAPLLSTGLNGPYQCVIPGGVSQPVVAIFNLPGGAVSVRVYSAPTS